MCFEERIKQLIFIHENIKKRNTGTYRDLGQRLNMSKSNVFRIVETIRGFGADIRWDRDLQSYYYANDFEIEFHIKMKG